MNETDSAILKERQAAFLARTEPKQGDVIRFNDGKMARMAHVYDDSIQPTIHIGSGSFYLGDGYMEYSGGLESPISMDKFTRTSETIQAQAWFFHDGHVQAYNGIDVLVNCPVWECDAPAPENWHETYRLTQPNTLWKEQQHCEYNYLITKGGTNMTAFVTAETLDAWMKRENLRLSEDLAPVGEFKTQKLVKEC